MPTDANDTRRRARAAAEWAALRDRLRTITPQAVGRAALAAAAAAGAIWLTVSSWPALLPFIVGGIIAYGLLPVVDALDRVMPRALAALVAVSGTVLAIGAVFVLVLPPLARGFVRFATDLPTSAEIDAAISDLQAQVGALPDGSATVVVPVLTTLATAVRDVLAGASGGLDDLVRSAIGALLNAVGALIGLIVLPAWMLTMMTEKHRARAVIDRRMAPWLKGDAWAIAAIADRAAGAYLRGYVVVAVLVGLLVYVGANISPRVGGPTFQEPLALAVLAGATQVVPIVGPFLGLVPAALILPIDPARAAVYLVIYLGALFIGGSILGARVRERRLGVHPAILVPGVVMIGQFGVLWLLLSAPIVAIAVNLVRYLHGRLSEPPRPAGLLPGTAVRVAPRPVAARAPSSYRTGQPPPPLVRATPAAPPPT
jgi:predicted PurR-regulated permease PerM